MSNSDGRTMTRCTFEIIAVLYIEDDDYYRDIIMMLVGGFLKGWKIEDCDRLNGYIKVYKDNNYGYW